MARLIQKKFDSQIEEALSEMDHDEAVDAANSTLNEGTWVEEGPYYYDPISIMIAEGVTLTRNRVWD